MNCERCRVAIIGAGPSGLALASKLAQAGIDEVVVLERETSAGGIPRQCGHSPFGLREFQRLLTGPGYARRLVERAREQGVVIRTGVTVAAIGSGRRLTLSTPDGSETLEADKIVICTGNRETPRAPRLVSGSRPLGIINSGALQSLVYLKRRLPFKRPLIVGTELVAFSALLTCRHAGIRPVAMVDAEARLTTWPIAALLPPLLGTRLLLNTRLDAIRGVERVEAVDLVDANGDRKKLECDGVIFSGRFVSESSLVKVSHLEMDAASGGARIDQYGRCSDPDYFACGNILHPVDTAGWCWNEGRATAASVVASLDGRLVASERNLAIGIDSALIRYFTPQLIALPAACRVTNPEAPHRQLQIRLLCDAAGRLLLRDGEQVLCSRKIRARPERRVLLPLPSPESLRQCRTLTLDLQPA